MSLPETSARKRRRALCAAGVLLAIVPAIARASLLSGEALDTAADIMAWVVLVVAPAIAIVVFWIVHVMPEKIAEKRHHPQTAAIQTLCLLSLVFGGLLWPIAWLWAYTKPVLYKMAYGTEKHDEFFVESGEKAREGNLLAAEMQHLRQELDAIAARGALSPKLAKLRDDLIALRPVEGEAARIAENEAETRGD
jgi:CBS domain containing-hemolysin-like protein